MIRYVEVGYRRITCAQIEMRFWLNSHLFFEISLWPNLRSIGMRLRIMGTWRHAKGQNETINKFDVEVYRCDHKWIINPKSKDIEQRASAMWPIFLAYKSRIILLRIPKTANSIEKRCLINWLHSRGNQRQNKASHCQWQKRQRKHSSEWKKCSEFCYFDIKARGWSGKMTVWSNIIKNSLW